MTVALPTSPSIAPPSAPAPLRATAGERILCAVLAALAFGVLGVAAWLTPSASGTGTHEGLGMPACGWMTAYNLPCPSCGMTTAFSYAAHGSLLASARVQPMGFVLAIGTAATALVCTHVSLTGSRLAHVLGARLTPRVLLALGVFAVLAWAWKIAIVRGYLTGTT